MAAMKGVIGLVLLTTFGLVSGSAIPMWEFLSRGEKMSHLFNMFVKQVEEHCDQSTMPDCNKVLMVYGLTNLAKMDDDSLDKMDPYQRGAKDIIWDSMMKGSYKSPAPGATPSASTAPTSPSPSRRAEAQDIYSSGEDDGDLRDDGNALAATLAGHAGQSRDDVSRFVFGHGPMVVRVMPDGSPVPGDAERPLPRDEDAEEYRLMRGQPMPSLEDLQQQQQQQQRSRPTVQSQHRQRGQMPSSPSGSGDHDRYQSNSPPAHFSRFPQLSASQPHAKFALPPPGMNFRIASRPHQQ